MIVWLACATAPVGSVDPLLVIDGDPARIEVADDVEVRAPGAERAIAMRPVPDKPGRWAPLAPLKRGVVYTWTDGEHTASHEVPPIGAPEVTCSLFPTADTIPENHLKFLVACTGPMRAPADLFSLVSLVTSDGPIPMAFSEVALWDPSREYLTLLLHPGRQKQGIPFGAALGPVLREGERVELRIVGLEDAFGRPVSDLVRAYAVGPADRTSPDPKTWRIELPGSKHAPLVVAFDEPLDALLIRDAFRVQGVDGPAPTSVVRGTAERSVQLSPQTEWPAGPLQLLLAGPVEDLAANAADRLFDRPVGTPRTPIDPLLATFEVR